MSRVGAAPRAAGSTSSARAAASRRNGARSRGPKTAEGKARSARNALKHGLRAQQHVVLPQEDDAAFAALAAALIEELAPVGALQGVLVGRIAAAAWRLERAERLEVEVFALRGYGGASPGLTLIRDGNGTRSIEALMRYRAAAMAELTRSLRTLKTLQTEQAKTVAPTAGVAASKCGQAVEQAAAPTLAAPAREVETAVPAPKKRARTTTAACALPDRARPDEPERAAVLQLDDAMPRTPVPDRTLHEPTAAGYRTNPGPAPIRSRPQRLRGQTNPRPSGARPTTRN